jgi:hypothetical protein
MQIPSVARMVHYVSHGSLDGTYPMACRAAVVTEVTQHPEADPTVGLCVMNPTGLFLNPAIPCDLGTDPAEIPGEYPATQLCDGRWYKGGTWHWPARI